MGYWQTRGLRGSSLEELINFTNERYRKLGVALLQKVPTPITPVEVDNANRRITLAYFERQSTVDYIGAAQGVPICFDAKETGVKNLPLHNIHPHQLDFMSDFEHQGGLAFLLVSFTALSTYYLLPLETLHTFWESAQAGGRKSIPLSAFSDDYQIFCRQGILDYLPAVDTYLQAQTPKA